MARRKVKNGEKSRTLLFFVPYFSARLDFPSPPLSAPGSPRMSRDETVKNTFQGYCTSEIYYSKKSLSFFQFTGIEAISGVSVVAFTSLAWMKFAIADKLSSASLRTDGTCVGMMIFDKLNFFLSISGSYIYLQLMNEAEYLMKNYGD